MSWSKVSTTNKKPLGWWYHKIMCEIGYHFFGSCSKMYSNHLKIMGSKYKFNLYGQSHETTHIK